MSSNVQLKADIASLIEKNGSEAVVSTMCEILYENKNQEGNNGKTET